MSKKIKLENFNNLNKNLNFSFYDVHYVETAKDKIAVNEYIHKNYNAKKLTEILRTITKKIGANVLNISKQDYDPIAASVNFLITEAPMDPKIVDKSCNLGHLSNRTCKLAHLDKSHIAVHTYPEFSKKSNISTFRIDINVSTCGLISPLHCLNYLLDEFSVKTYTDVVYIDYFVRGFTRTASDKKIFIDHKPAPISNFINREFKKEYHIVEDDFPKFNIWTAKLIVKNVDPKAYLFNQTNKKLSSMEKQKISQTVIKEINEIANINKNLKIKVK